MRIGLCTSSASPPSASAMTGIAYLEENVQSFLAPEGPESAFESRLAQAATLGVRIEVANCFLPADLKCVGPSTDPARLRGWADTACRRARRTGIDTIVIGSGGSRQIPPGWSAAQATTQFVTFLQDIAPTARAHGVRLAVEPLHRGECNFINTIAEGVEIVRAVAQDSVQLVVDLFHMARNDQPPAAIRAAQGLVAHAHVAERGARTAPGRAGDDLRGYLSALRAGGYARRISFECTWQDLAAELPPAVAALNTQLQDAGY